jgi:hypothetical protein
MNFHKLTIILASLVVLANPVGRAAGLEGELIQSNNIGMNVATLNLESGTSKNIATSGAFSQFVGLHYYVADGLRVGVNLQFTEQVWGALPPSGNSFSTFGILPQVGWDFWGPMYGAFVFSILPWTSGEVLLDLGVQGVIGAALPLSKSVRLTAALEVPFNFKVARTIGITPLAGMSWKFNSVD